MVGKQSGIDYEFGNDLRNKDISVSLFLDDQVSLKSFVVLREAMEQLGFTFYWLTVFDYKFVFFFRDDLKSLPQLAFSSFSKKK